MEIITYNPQKCKFCGLCATVCINEVTNQKKGAVPQIVRPEKCILCGHCVAVCPNDAITHNRMDIGHFRPIREGAVTADEMENLLCAKRSVRHFSGKPVRKDVLERIVNVARMSPSVSNRQDRGFIVVSDPALLQKIEDEIVTHYRRLLLVLNPPLRKILSLVMPRAAKELEKAATKFNTLLRQAEKRQNPVLRAAPAVVLIHGPKTNAASRDDCLAAQHYLMLLAQTIGLGTCINGFIQFAPAALEKLLDIPKGHRIFAATTVGYPRYKYIKTVDRKPADVRYM